MFKKILACSVSRRVIVIAWFSCLSLKAQLGLCSSNCHAHAMTGNCSASYRVLANSLRVISAKRGNPPQCTDEIPPNALHYLQCVLHIRHTRYCLVCVFISDAVAQNFYSIYCFNCLTQLMIPIKVWLNFDSLRNQKFQTLITSLISRFHLWCCRSKLL